MAATIINDLGVLPPWTVEGHRDPKAWYMAMHERGPIHRDERSGVWMFVGWKAVRDFLSQPKIWSTAKRNESVDEANRIIRLLTSDPPIHLKLRSYFIKAYRPDRIAQIELRIRSLCNELMNNCLAKGTFDVVADYLKPLAVITICELIGIPKEDESKMTSANSGPVYLGGVAPADSNPSVLEMLNPGKQVALNVSKVAEYFNNLVAARQSDPQDDLITELGKIQPGDLDGKIDIPALLFEQFGAGTNTTIHLFTSLIHELFVNPELLSRVREDRSLIEPLINETLRLHSPLQARPRVLTQDIELCGEIAREGDTALGWLAAANLDPSVFPDPLKFDIDRSGDHVAFGRHEHVCLGMHLARMELRTALDVWLNSIQEFEPVSGAEVPWVQDFILHGADEFPVRIIS